MTRNEEERGKLDRLLIYLSHAVEFPEHLEHPEVIIYKDFKGDFREKLNYVLRRRKYNRGEVIHFDNFVWKKCEIGNLTSGNQLLRTLVALFRDKAAISPGDAIILTINGKADSAILMFNYIWIEMKSPSETTDSKRRYYEKLFDKKRCELSKRNPDYKRFYTVERLAEIRSPLPGLLQTFLQKPIICSQSEYRRAFIGLLQEFAKFQMEGVPVYDQTRQIPVAVCIWLAVKHTMSEKLQAVFGESLRVQEEEDLKKKWLKKNPNLSDDEMRSLVIHEKARRRVDAAKDIITWCGT